MKGSEVGDGLGAEAGMALCDTGVTLCDPGVTLCDTGVTLPVTPVVVAAVASGAAALSGSPGTDVAAAEAGADVTPGAAGAAGWHAPAARTHARAKTDTTRRAGIVARRFSSCPRD